MNLPFRAMMVVVVVVMVVVMMMMMMMMMIIQYAGREYHNISDLSTTGITVHQSSQWQASQTNPLQFGCLPPLPP